MRACLLNCRRELRPVRPARGTGLRAGYCSGTLLLRDQLMEERRSHRYPVVLRDMALIGLNRSKPGKITARRDETPAEACNSFCNRFAKDGRVHAHIHTHARTHTCMYMRAANAAMAFSRLSWIRLDYHRRYDRTSLRHRIAITPRLMEKLITTI